MKSLRFVAMMLGLCFINSGFAFGEEYSFNSNGTRLSYTVEGEGEPVVLIHGYRASGQLNWRAAGVIRALKSDYRVIVPDMRAHGNSDVAADDKYGVEMVEDVRRLLDHLGIEKAHLVGYSMGGMITIKFMTKYPERVKSAIIGGMGWYQEREYRGGNGNPNTPSHYRAVAQSFPELSTTEKEMRAISDIPTTVIIGSDDELMRRVEDWQSIEPELPVVLVENATHMTCVFRPAFRDGIREALDQRRTLVAD